MVTAYLLFSGGGLLLGGRIADLLPRRRIFMLGMSLFTGASLLSGFASTGGELIAGRAMQGAGRGTDDPGRAGHHHDHLRRRPARPRPGTVGRHRRSRHRRRRPVGGALTTWAGWQAIFWVNVPIGILTLVAGHPDPAEERPTRVGLARFDIAGAATVVTGLATLMYALSETETHGWTSARTFTLGVSAAPARGFVAIERRVAQPLVHPHTWKISSLVSSTAVMLGVTGLVVGTVFLTSIFFQTALGFSALQPGLAALPLASPWSSAPTVAGTCSHVTPAASPRPAGPGRSRRAASLPRRPDASYAADLLPGLLVIGIGPGMVFVAVSATAMAGIPDQHAGVASGFLMTGHEVGAALGVAVLSAVATRRPAEHLAGAARFERASSARPWSPRVRRLRPGADASHPGGRRRCRNAPAWTRDRRRRALDVHEQRRPSRRWQPIPSSSWRSAARQEVFSFVAAWVGLGYLLPESDEAYLLMGIPLTMRSSCGAPPPTARAVGPGRWHRNRVPPPRRRRRPRCSVLARRTGAFRR